MDEQFFINFNFCGRVWNQKVGQTHKKVNACRGLTNTQPLKKLGHFSTSRVA